PIQGKVSQEPRLECQRLPDPAISLAWVWARVWSCSSHARPPSPDAARSWLTACTTSPVTPPPEAPGGAHAAAARASATTATRGAALRHSGGKEGAQVQRHAP